MSGIVTGFGDNAFNGIVAFAVQFEPRLQGFHKTYDWK